MKKLGTALLSLWILVLTVCPAYADAIAPSFEDIARDYAPVTAVVVLAAAVVLIAVGFLVRAIVKKRGGKK